jgi:hypothetical protein
MLPGNRNLKCWLYNSIGSQLLISGMIGFLNSDYPAYLQRLFMWLAQPQ